MSRKALARKHLTLAPALAGALVVAGCGGGQANKGSATGHEKVTLEFWSWGAYEPAAVEKWNSTHPDVQVHIDKIPAGSGGGYQKMFSAVTAGNPPDLATIEYQELPAFVTDDALADLSKYEAGKQKSQFVGWQWQQVAFGDHIYAMPNSSGPMALFYRKDIFSGLGLAAPKTWAEFADDAAKIHAADPNQYITNFGPGGNAWFTGLAWQAGAHWFDTSGDTWTVNMTDPATKKVADYWQTLINGHQVKVEDYYTDTWYKDLQNNSIVALPAASWIGLTITQQAPKTAGKWAMAPLPQWDAGKSASANWGGISVAVFKGSKHPKEAAEFAAWMGTSVDGQNTLTDYYDWPAMANAASKLSALTQPRTFFGGQSIADVFGPATDNIDVSWKWIPTTSATYEHLTDGFQTAVTGKGTIMDAVTSTQQKTIADLKAKGLSAQAAG